MESNGLSSTIGGNREMAQLNKGFPSKFSFDHFRSKCLRISMYFDEIFDLIFAKISSIIRKFSFDFFISHQEDWVSSK